MTGDFNAHSQLWGYGSDDNRGQQLFSQISSKRLIVVNDPHCLPTFETTHLQGWPDVTLASLSFFSDILEWSVDEDLNFADHRLITINIDAVINKLPRRRYRTKGISFRKFNSYLATKLSQSGITFYNPTIADLENNYDRFLQILIETCNHTLKKRKSTMTPKIRWWTQDLRQKRNLTTALYRRSKRYPSQETKDQYRKARAQYRRAIAKAKEDAWKNFCSKTRNPYGKAKQIALQEFYRQEIFALETTVQEPININKHFENLSKGIFGPSHYPLEPSTKKANFPIAAPSITDQEIKKAVYSFNLNKAPGIDNLDHRIIRNLLKTIPNILKELYNSVLFHNHFIDQWKIGELVFFYKTGKPLNNPKSYRPITLLPIFGKIYEKILLRRIIYHLNKNHEKLHPSQHGFQDNKSTETALADLLSKIDLNIQNNMYTSLISLDFAGAFDSLQWNATHEEVRKLNIPSPYANTLHSYLSYRRSLTHWKSGVYHRFNRGCPQGSCLGPLLWRIFMNALLKLLEKNKILFIAFADDLLLIINGTSRRALEQKGHEALKIILQWAMKNNLIIAVDKCSSMTIQKPCSLKRLPIYKINNIVIKNTNQLKYLGIIIDPKLSFLPHVNSKRREIQKVIQNLLRFASSNGGLSKEILKIWYITILEKKITYGAAIWYLRMQKSHGQRILSSIQAQCLLLVSGAYKKTSTAALCVLTGILPLALALEKEAIKGGVLRLGKNFGKYYSDIYQPKVSIASVCPYIPYFFDDINDQLPDVKIYTDGSHTGDGTGYAFCVYKELSIIYTSQTTLDVLNTIFQAELLAIKDAIHWGENSEYQRIGIYTDSQSGLEAISDFNTRDYLVQQIILQLQTTKKTFTFHWIKGHSGNQGNETADELAKQSITQPNKRVFFLLPRSHLEKEIKTKILKNWQDEWNTHPVGRYTFQLLPKVSLKTLLPHRNLYLFSTNHGPFFSYLHRIDRSESPYCVCGAVSTSLHYTQNCPLTTRFHIKKAQDLSLSQWFQLILQQKHLQNNIINCVSELANNQINYQYVQ